MDKTISECALNVASMKFLSLIFNHSTPKTVITILGGIITE